jgi:hypothetical protein
MSPKDPLRGREVSPLYSIFLQLEKKRCVGLLTASAIAAVDRRAFVAMGPTFVALAAPATARPRPCVASIAREVPLNAA